MMLRNFQSRLGTISDARFSAQHACISKCKLNYHTKIIGTFTPQVNKHSRIHQRRIFQKQIHTSMYKNHENRDGVDHRSYLYPHKYDVSMSIRSFIDSYATPNSTNLKKIESLAGRILSLNISDAQSIITLGSLGCELKVVFGPEVLSEAQVALKSGDIIGVTGHANWCSSNELYFDAFTLKRLVPCLKEIDNEIGKERYLDLIRKPKLYEKFRLRSQVISTIENFLETEQFLEVETPITSLTMESRNSHPFITHHQDHDYSLALRNSSHRYLKMLAVGGLDKVYEIGKQFKNIRSSDQTPEYTTCEMCITNADYKDGMKLLERMLLQISTLVEKLSVGEMQLPPNVPVVDIVSTLEALIGEKLPDQSCTSEEMLDLCLRHGVDTATSETNPQLLQKLIHKFLIKPCTSPVFFMNPPTSIETFSKRNGPISEHFYFCMNGKIRGWGSSVLNNPIDLRSILGNSNKKSVQLANRELVTAIEYGLYPSCEVSILLDSLISTLVNSSKLEDVILFPLDPPPTYSEETIQTELSSSLEETVPEEFTSTDEEVDFHNMRLALIERRRLGGDSLYSNKVTSTIQLADFLNQYGCLKPGETSTDVHTIDARITSVRESSKKLKFLDISKNFFKLQVVANGKFYDGDFKEDCRHLGKGDIISVTGVPFRTKRSELSIRAHSIRYITPCLRVVPHSHVGLIDLEDRFRNRHVDLIMNKSTKKTFEMRARIISYTRKFLEDRGFAKVETPILNPAAGGAAATPFVTRYGSSDLFLRIAPELFLKMLVTGGMERVYEIGRQFRNEGLTRFHNPEFTTCEFYMAYSDYNDLLDLTEKYLSDMVHMLHGSYKIQWSGETIDFTPPFKRVHMMTELEKITGLKLPNPEFLHTDESRSMLSDICRQNNVNCSEPRTSSRLLDKLVSQFLETQYVNPTFIMDHPKIMSPLAKEHRSINGLTERFELFVGRKEICDAYTELNDPVDQRRRFEEQLHAKNSGDSEAQDVDETFLGALEVGLPPTAGWGMGIDRLCMMLTNSDSIRQVLLFPMMKPKKERAIEKKNSDVKSVKSQL